MGTLVSQLTICALWEEIQQLHTEIPLSVGRLKPQTFLLTSIVTYFIVDFQMKNITLHFIQRCYCEFLLFLSLRWSNQKMIFFPPIIVHPVCFDLSHTTAFRIFKICFTCNPSTCNPWWTTNVFSTKCVWGGVVGVYICPLLLFFSLSQLICMCLVHVTRSLKYMVMFYRD